MPDHPLTTIGSGGQVYVQESQPTETPNPEDGGGVWYQTDRLTNSISSSWEYQFTTSDYEAGAAAKDGYGYIGGDSGVLYKLDLTDGSEQWSFTAKNFISTGITIADGKVLFNGNDALYAVDITDGSEVWSNTIADPYSLGYEIAVSNGTIVTGDGGGNVYGIDLTDSTVLWTTSTGSGAVGWGVDINNDIAVIGGDSTYALNISDGSTVWSVGVTSPRLVKIDGTNVWLSDGNVYDLNTGDKLFSTDVSGLNSRDAVIKDDIIAAGDDNGNIVGLNRRSGQTEWTYQTSDTNINSVAIDGYTAYFTKGSGGSTYKGITALNITDGSLKWIYNVDSDPYGIATDGDTVFTGEFDAYAHGITQNIDTVYGTPKISTGTDWIQEV